MTVIKQNDVDFEKLESRVVSAYLRVRPYYEDLSGVVARVIEECLSKREIHVHSVQHRAKDPVSFGRKATIPSAAFPNRPKYEDPLIEITDLAGVRVITNVLVTIDEVDKLLNDEFKIVEKSDKGKDLLTEDRFGYQSVHYLVQISKSRYSLAEYEKYTDGIVEVQVRTILQHAWAELEHDIQYKSSYSIPVEVRRRFMALAGMLEVADREFQAIQNLDRELSDHAEVQVRAGNLTGVEITPKALKALLDKKLGPDKRMSDWSYEWAGAMVRRLGFVDLSQVDKATSLYDDSEISRLADGSRQGQITRFEHVLLAALGEKFINRHEWADQLWFSQRRLGILDKLRTKGIEVGTYDPLEETIQSL